MYPSLMKNVMTVSQIGEVHKGIQLLTIPEMINLADTC